MSKINTKAPSETAVNAGRFKPGNKAAKGNPYAKKCAELRAALYASVSADDVRRIIETLKTAALAGDLKAIALLLERVFGSPQPLDLIERLEVLEEKLKENDTHENH